VDLPAFLLFFFADLFVNSYSTPYVLIPMFL